jgi:hypothetical protein
MRAVNKSMMCSVGVWWYILHPINIFTNCDDTPRKDDKPRKLASVCDKYNSLFYRLQSKRRISLCSDEVGCIFEGMGRKAVCKESTALERPVGSLPVKPENHIKSENNENVTLETPEKPEKYSLVLENERAGSDSPVLAIEILMKESFTSSVADSIVNAHEAAHQVSKALVIEVLQNKENVNKLGILMRNCFAYETVRAPVRDLAYFYLHTNDSMENILWQLQWQRGYWFQGGGKVSSKFSLKTGLGECMRVC